MRLRELVPAVPHVAVQASARLHSLSRQSTAHGSSLQLCEFVSAGHMDPPFAGCTTTDRDRVCPPPPQVNEHALNADQLPTMQSTGQGSVLHDCVSASATQCPPVDGGTVTDRDRVCNPSGPQVFVQLSYSLQALTCHTTKQSQSINRSYLWQASGSISEPGSLPDSWLQSIAESLPALDCSTHRSVLE